MLSTTIVVEPKTKRKYKTKKIKEKDLDFEGHLKKAMVEDELLEVKAQT
jgi:hypothetical protein